MPRIDKAVRRDNKISKRKLKKHNPNALASEQQKKLKEEQIKKERRIKQILLELGYDDE